tara:strand:- start:375 stop:572 length:198 start_codon:yes stop_codon:yes gene_type:complete
MVEHIHQHLPPLFPSQLMVAVVLEEKPEVLEVMEPLALVVVEVELMLLHLDRDIEADMVVLESLH